MWKYEELALNRFLSNYWKLVHDTENVLIVSNHESQSIFFTFN